MHSVWRAMSDNGATVGCLIAEYDMSMQAVGASKNTMSGGGEVSRIMSVLHRRSDYY